MWNFRRVLRAAAAVWLCVVTSTRVISQDPPAETEQSAARLRDDQLAVSGRFARFERMLSQMADILGRQDPERADLLRRAISKGREERVGEEIEQIVELLNREEFGDASEQQKEVINSLRTLLTLLQSEDRRSSVERERDRLNAILKDVRGVIAQEKSVRAATQNAEAPSSAAPGQQKALEQTDKLLDSIENHEAESGSGDKDGGEATPASPADQQQGEPNDPARTPSDGDRPPETPSGEKPSESQNEGAPSSGKSPSSGQNQGDSKPQEKTPGQKQLRNAREQMQQALDALREQQREQALKNEDQAMQELLNAADQLEEMLRQLREEEKEMLLASLEARLQRMLSAETQIHEGTVSLAATPQADWLDQYYSRCRELAQVQAALAEECGQTANLLKEDGTSVSILLAVEDVQADMSSVTSWLQESRVGSLTQSVQTDILESLKQMIEATQQEMQDMKEQQQQQQQQQSPDSNKPALVKLMAEIRMLRTLQLQVNRRTKQLDEAITSSSSADRPGILVQLRKLAARQQRLIETAAELARQVPKP